MRKEFEKNIERLEERKTELEQITAKCTVTQKLRDTNYGYFSAISHAQELVNQVASEYDGGMPATCNDAYNDALAMIEKIKDIIREEEHFEVSNSIEIPRPNKADYDAVHAEKFNRIWKIISEAE